VIRLSRLLDGVSTVPSPRPSRGSAATSPGPLCLCQLLRLETFVEVPKIDGSRVGTGHALRMEGSQTQTSSMDEVRAAARILHGCPI
jgi:hypothetical protein